MTNTVSLPLEAPQTGEKLSLQNAPLRESQSPGDQENQRIVTMSFNDANAPKRESSVKPPVRVPNSERRSREFLTEEEVEKLMTAAEKVGRHGHRDSTLVLVAYRHALRVSELIALRWDLRRT